MDLNFVLKDTEDEGQGQYWHAYISYVYLCKAVEDFI